MRIVIPRVVREKMKINSETKDAETKKTLVQLVDAAFSDKVARKYANEYLETIRSNWRYVESIVKRTVLLALLLMAIFELMSQSSIQEVTLGPVKLTNLTLIYKFLPLAISFCFYYLMNLIQMQITYSVIHRRIMNQVYSPISMNKIESFLPPPYTSIFGDITFIPKQYKLYVVVEHISTVIAFGVIFGALVFEIYAFQRLFTAFGSADILVWCILGGSLLLLLQAFLVIFADPGRSDKW